MGLREGEGCREGCPQVQAAAAAGKIGGSSTSKGKGSREGGTRADSSNGPDRGSSDCPGGRGKRSRSHRCPLRPGWGHRRRLRPEAGPVEEEEEGKGSSCRGVETKSRPRLRPPRSQRAGAFSSRRRWVCCAVRCCTVLCFVVFAPTALFWLVEHARRSQARLELFLEEEHPPALSGFVSGCFSRRKNQR